MEVVWPTALDTGLRIQWFRVQILIWAVTNIVPVCSVEVSGWSAWYVI